MNVFMSSEASVKHQVVSIGAIAPCVEMVLLLDVSFAVGDENPTPQVIFVDVM